MKLRLFMLTAGLALLAGCANTPKQVLTAPMPAVVLSSAADAYTTMPLNPVVHFPAGTYQAALKDKRGTYYRSPSPVVMGKDVIFHNAYLYIEDETSKQGFWTDKTIRFWLKEPLPISFAH